MWLTDCIPTFYIAHQCACVIYRVNWFFFTLKELTRPDQTLWGVRETIHNGICRVFFFSVNWKTTDAKWQPNQSLSFLCSSWTMYGPRDHAFPRLGLAKLLSCYVSSAAHWETHGSVQYLMQPMEGSKPQRCRGWEAPPEHEETFQFGRWSE